jgi:hypothetical protein
VARDAALGDHLQRSETLFRTFLRSSTRTYQTAYQLLWYMDEIVTRDPLFVFLTEPDPVDRVIGSVRNNLGLLFQWRPYMETGYLLLAGDGVIPPLQDDAVTAATQLASATEVERILDEAVSYGMAHRPGPAGKEWVIYEATLDTGFVVAFYHPALPPEQSTSPGYIFGEQLPRTDLSQIVAATKTLARNLGSSGIRVARVEG